MTACASKRRCGSSVLITSERGILFPERLGRGRTPRRERGRAELLRERVELPTRRRRDQNSLTTAQSFHLRGALAGNAHRSLGRAFARARLLEYSAEPPTERFDRGER